jgi:microcystin-dependent protein
VSQPYIGEIRLFAFNFAPAGWAVCDGSLYSIADNQALFALLGTTFGGDGQQTFGLPDLRGRVPIHRSAQHALGQWGGAESATLQTANLPPHVHTVPGATTQTSDRPSGLSPAQGDAFGRGDSTMTASGVTGSGLPFETMPPFLAVNPCISLFGIFPSQA